MCESQVLATAIAGDELGALLSRGPMAIIDANGTCPAIFNEGALVELVDKFTGYWPLQYSVSLFEVALHHLNFEPRHIVTGVSRQEVAHIYLELFVRKMPVQKAHP
jgi:hypothetical protein